MIQSLGAIIFIRISIEDPRTISFTDGKIPHFRIIITPFKIINFIGILASYFFRAIFRASIHNDYIIEELFHSV
ncbi:hypothetical protein ES703_109032 [subsurface metagenome]